MCLCACVQPLNRLLMDWLYTCNFMNASSSTELLYTIRSIYMLEGWTSKQSSICIHSRAVDTALHREEGIKGLWRGIGPNVGRNAIVNAAELASYDQVCLADSGQPMCNAIGEVALQQELHIILSTGMVCKPAFIWGAFGT